MKKRSARNTAVRMALGAMTGAGAGRADDRAVTAPRGAHVIPADVVSALGDGNTRRGHAILEDMFSKSKRSTSKLRRADGGGVRIQASDGEFIVSPEDVALLGAGNAEAGHELLNKFIEQSRADYAARQQSFPGPKP